MRERSGKTGTGIWTGRFCTDGMDACGIEIPATEAGRVNDCASADGMLPDRDMPMMTAADKPRDVEEGEKYIVDQDTFVHDDNARCFHPFSIA